MNFDLTKEQEALRQRVRDFAEQEIRPVARENDEQQHFDVELTLKMGELGLLGMVVPREYGGQGLDNLSILSLWKNWRVWMALQLPLSLRATRWA